jgi:hypothetical protein
MCHCMHAVAGNATVISFLRYGYVTFEKRVIRYFTGTVTLQLITCLAKKALLRYFLMTWEAFLLTLQP